ncbi:MAG TPA: hypothetical protein VFE47_14750 [Tepidisphaeraceae bacterium]|jgi:hypothetical protein|nr:hypothetical protein [Tepidisphaeraceae bacterium]
MNLFRSGVIVFGILLLAQSARAQVPFFFRGASAFTPEISIVNTGALLDMQATVSADRKYVTLNARPQNSTLLALRSFNFQQGGTNFGNVGDPPRANNAGGSAVRTSPSDILAHARSEASVLRKSGMSLVSKLKE